MLYDQLLKLETFYPECNRLYLPL